MHIKKFFNLKKNYGSSMKNKDFTTQKQLCRVSNCRVSNAYFFYSNSYVQNTNGVTKFLFNVLSSQHSKLSENIYLKAMEQNAELHRMFEIRRQNCHGRFSSRK